MAIVIIGKTGCALCGSIFAASDDVVMFPHFIRDQAHPLWRFSDSAMHHACFADWDQREQFRGIYNEVSTIMPNHPREMQPSGTIIELGAGPAA
jgi:hypothetical protein